MNLRNWCLKTGYSLSDVMRAAGVSYTTVLRGADGRLNRYSSAKAIEHVTEGKVSVDELCAQNDPGEE